MIIESFNFAKQNNLTLKLITSYSKVDSFWLMLEQTKQFVQVLHKKITFEILKLEYFNIEIQYSNWNCAKISPIVCKKKKE